MYTVENSRHFRRMQDPVSGAVYYVMDTHVAAQQQGFYFVNPSMSDDGRYLWFYCSFPPALYRTLGVVDFLTDEVYHFPETQYAGATPLVDTATGHVYYADDAAVYRRSPNPAEAPVLIAPLPAVMFENNARVINPATHLTFSPDKKQLFLDAVTTKGWVAGALTMETGEFQVYCRPQFHRNHGQFNPVYPGLALMAEDFFGGFKIRTDENGVYMRLWTVTSDGEEKVWPPLDLQKATHEWWSADGRKIYYCRYDDVSNNGVCAIDIFTGEHKMVAPVRAWHSHSTADDKLFIFDENDGFYRGCPSRVGLYNTTTGKKVYIVSQHEALASREKPSKYHLDPHPRFNGQEKYIVFTTVTDGHTDLAVAKTADILPLTE